MMFSRVMIALTISALVATGTSSAVNITTIDGDLQVNLGQCGQLAVSRAGADGKNLTTYPEQGLAIPQAIALGCMLIDGGSTVGCSRVVLK